MYPEYNPASGPQGIHGNTTASQTSTLQAPTEKTKTDSAAPQSLLIPPVHTLSRAGHSLTFRFCPAMSIDGGAD